MKRKHQSEHVFRVLIDSRTRLPGTTHANAIFSLSRAISNVSQVRCRNFVFTNSLFNVAEGNDTLVLSSGTFTATHAFWSPADLVTAINGAAIGCTLTLNLTTNVISWACGANTINVDDTTLKEALGLQENQTYTGNFDTQLFLASPINVDVICPQLQSGRVVYSSNQRREDTPIISVPVTAGFGAMVLYEPASLPSWHVGGSTIGMLNFNITDSWTGRELSELGPWSLQLEIIVSY